MKDDTTPPVSQPDKPQRDFDDCLPGPSADCGCTICDNDHLHPCLTHDPKSALTSEEADLVIGAVPLQALLPVSQGAESLGTSNCPICGYNEPHNHDSSDLMQRPQIDGARTAFEKAINDGKLANSLFSALGLRSFPTREYPWGPYTEKVYQDAWWMWRVAWMAAKSTVPVSKGVRAAAEEIARRWHAHDLPMSAQVQSLSLLQLQALAEDVISRCVTASSQGEGEAKYHEALVKAAHDLISRED